VFYGHSKYEQMVENLGVGAADFEIRKMLFEKFEK
jgi:hypothetical protein